MSSVLTVTGDSSFDSIVIQANGAGATVTDDNTGSLYSSTSTIHSIVINSAAGDSEIWLETDGFSLTGGVTLNGHNTGDTFNIIAPSGSHTLAYTPGSSATSASFTAAGTSYSFNSPGSLVLADFGVTYVAPAGDNTISESETGGHVYDEGLRPDITISDTVNGSAVLPVTIAVASLEIDAATNATSADTDSISVDVIDDLSGIFYPYGSLDFAYGPATNSLSWSGYSPSAITLNVAGGDTLTVDGAITNVATLTKTGDGTIDFEGSVANVAGTGVCAIDGGLAVLDGAFYGVSLTVRSDLDLNAYNVFTTLNVGNVTHSGYVLVEGNASANNYEVVSGSLTVDGELTGNIVTVDSGATLQAYQIELDTLNMAGNVTLVGGGPLVSTLNNLNFTETGTPTAVLQIVANTLTVANADPVALSTLINNGNITSFFTGSGYPVGFTMDGSAATILDVSMGDVNLDGTVNASDLAILQPNYDPAVTGAYWYQGDLNKDGVVDDTDLGLMATALGTDVIAIGGSPSVVEGSTYSLYLGYTAGSNPLTGDVIHWNDPGNHTTTIGSGASGSAYTCAYYTQGSSTPINIQIKTSGGTLLSTSTVNAKAVTVLDAPLIITGNTITGTQSGYWTGTIATFSDQDPSAPTTTMAANSFYGVSINWGDGSMPSTGTLTYLGTVTVDGNSANEYSISGSDTFATGGTLTPVITITDDTSVTNSGYATANVAGISGSAYTIPASTSSAINGAIVGDFTDNAPDAATTTYGVTITWASGHTIAGTYSSDGNGGYLIKSSTSSTYTYSTVGLKAATITITPMGDSRSAVTLSGYADVTTIASATGSTSISAQQGMSTGSIVVATFVDTTNSSHLLTVYNPVIDWGDGSTSDSTDGVAVSWVSGSPGHFAVSGSHTYADAGSFSPVVTLTDRADSAHLATATSTSGTATVSGITVTAATINAVQDTGLSSVPVATFTDNLPGVSDYTSVDYSATIDWGDGNTSAGTITLSGGVYTVTGSNTYTYAGTFDPTVTVTSLIDNRTSSGYGEADVSGITVSEEDFNGTVGTALGTDTIIAEFTDTDTLAGSSAGDYTASIDWLGNGTNDTNPAHYSIDSLAGGGFDVLGSHTYSAAGEFSPVVTITDTSDSLSGATADSGSITSISTISGSSTITATQDTSYTGAVATFGDSADSNPLDYSASIDWGDGNISSGTITYASSVFTVAGTNNFFIVGTLHPAVTITDPTGATASTSATASVYGIAVTSSATNINAAPGTSTTLSAYFTNSISGASTLASGYEAVIKWGDGTTTTSGYTISAYGSGFNITDSHTYSAVGTYGITLGIEAVSGGQVGSVNSTANVSQVALGSSASLSTLVGAPISDTTVLASFTDSVSGGTYSAYIDWGNGDTATGTVTNTSGDNYTVTAPAEAYDQSGTYNVHVTVTDPDGGTSTIDATVNVNALYTPSAPVVTLTGSSYDTATVNWTDQNGDARTGMQLEEDDLNTGSFAIINPTISSNASGDTETYTVSGLSLNAGDTYTFRALAAGAGLSQYSDDSDQVAAGAAPGSGSGYTPYGITDLTASITAWSGSLATISGSFTAPSDMDLTALAAGEAAKVGIADPPDPWGVETNVVWEHIHTGGFTISGDRVSFSFSQMIVSPYPVQAYIDFLSYTTTSMGTNHADSNLSPPIDVTLPSPIAAPTITVTSTSGSSATLAISPSDGSGRTTYFFDDAGGTITYLSSDSSGSSFTFTMIPDSQVFAYSQNEPGDVQSMYSNFVDPSSSVAAVSVSLTQNGAILGRKPAIFTVSRTGSTSSSLTVYYTLGGTAVPGPESAPTSGISTDGSDYTGPTPASGYSGVYQVTIPAGETSATVTLTPESEPGDQPAKAILLNIVQPPPGVTGDIYAEGPTTGPSTQPCVAGIKGDNEKIITLQIQPAQSLTQSDKDVIDKDVENLGSNDYHARAAAQIDLLDRGWAKNPAVRNYLMKQVGRNDEAKQRLAGIIRKLGLSPVSSLDTLAGTIQLQNDGTLTLIDPKEPTNLPGGYVADIDIRSSNEKVMQILSNDGGKTYRLYGVDAGKADLIIHVEWNKLSGGSVTAPIVQPDVKVPVSVTEPD